MSDYLEFPIFDRAMDETPSPMSADQALAALEEIISELDLLANDPPRREVIEPFVL